MLAAEAGDPRAALELQPGAYGCSTTAIDRMVDIALSVPGVLGAQLSGAGLGGCMMVLAKDDALDAVEDAMRTFYYDPEGIAPEVIRCRAMAGSGVL
jgi:N-acetylgalactosamine kinase